VPENTVTDNTVTDNTATGTRGLATADGETAVEVTGTGTRPAIISKSIARGGGRAGYRGEVRVDAGAHHSANTVRCDALLVDTISRSDTYPAIDIRVDDVQLGHEATVSKVSEEQLFYLMSRGMPEDEAMAMIVRGFIEPIARELPMEYALELNKLIEMGMEGSVG
jgi:Fe-S cluster assembly protein SufB